MVTHWAIGLAAIGVAGCARVTTDTSAARAAVSDVTGCYEGRTHFDSAGTRRPRRLMGGSPGIKADNVHPDSLGMGGGLATWIDTLALDGQLLSVQAPNPRGTRYHLRPEQEGEESWWQIRGDTVWIWRSSMFTASSDSLLVRGGELVGTRTYDTDEMAVIYATVHFKRAACWGYGASAS